MARSEGSHSKTLPARQRKESPAGNLYSPWHLVIIGIILVPVIIVLLGAAALIARASRTGRIGGSALHTELARINERLTSIEKVLKDIE